MDFLVDADRGGPRLAARRRCEARSGAAAARAGTCGPCLRPASFSGPTHGPRGPGWEAGQRCDCEDRLVAADRMLLHAALAVGGLRGWSRLLLAGPGLPVHRRLRAAASRCTHWPDPTGDPVSTGERGQVDLSVALERVDRAGSSGAVLRALRAAAAPGGALVARLRFDPDCAPDWDILEAARAAGWNTAEILRVWSRELGYLGASHFLLHATVS